MTNSTFKKADHATDITWTQTSIGGSDASHPAIWQSTTIGTAVAHRPEGRYYVKGSGPKKTVTVTVQYPSLSTDSTTGITSIIKRQRFKGVFEIDQEAPTTDVNEFVSQTVHLLSGTPMEVAIQGCNANVT